MNRVPTMFCAVALAAATPQQTIRDLAGRWSCVTWTGNITLRATTIDAMYGPWLRLNASYPAQHDQSTGTAVKFLGYDTANKRWTVSSIDDSGGYYVIYSNSPAFDRSRWSDGYPADGGTASISLVSANEYIFDAANPNGHGHTSRTHTICTRM